MQNVERKSIRLPAGSQSKATPDAGPAASESNATTDAASESNARTDAASESKAATDAGPAASESKATVDAGPAASESKATVDAGPAASESKATVDAPAAHDSVEHNNEILPTKADALGAPASCRHLCPFQNLNASLKSLALLAMPVSLVLYLFLSNPFKDELVMQVYSLTSLNANQQHNIDLAAKALDSRVLKPGELFSFNRALGPRSERRGYRAALAYVGPNSPVTAGGGICLASSALYQAALRLGLKIEERSPHLRTIASVSPGLDATVWYGRQDLKFRNNTKYPLQIHSECKNHNLYISLWGERNTNLKVDAELKTVTTAQSKDQILVEVFRDANGHRQFISRDNYHISK